MKWIYNFRVARLLGSGILIGPNWSLEWALLKRLEKESYELRHLREELACLSSSSVVRFHLQVRAVDLSQQTHEVVINYGRFYFSARTVSVRFSVPFFCGQPLRVFL